MAKLTGPLLSISASGQLAGTVVYATWKGIKYGRQYVSPANPNTADQQTQRGYLAEAVADWHDISSVINALDKTNLDRAALYHAKTLSGFNYYVMNQIDTRKASATIHQYYGSVESAIGAATFTVVVSSSVATASVTMRYGTSPTAMVNTKARTEGGTPGATHTFTPTGLSASTTYYYQIYSTVSNSVETAGTGKITTTA